MKRITVLASLTAVALLAFPVPAFAQGPMGGKPLGGYGAMGSRGGMSRASEASAGMGGYAPGYAPNQTITPTVPYGMMGGYGFSFGPSQAITPTVPYGFRGMMGGYGFGFGSSQAITPTVPYGYRGMMGGYGFGFGPSQAITPTVPYGFRGMMGGYGFGFGPGQAITPTVPYGFRGMMGGYGFGPSQAITPTVPYGFRGMMGGYGYAPSGTPITIDQAAADAQKYVAAYGNADLKLVELEEYSWNFYGVVQEKSTGTNAFQVLVDKYSGAVYPEMGPNMMWNTKYSPMAWRIGGGSIMAANTMSVTMNQAHANAAQYVKTYLPNATVEDTGDTFYGYYNFDVLQNGKTYGMLSVNGYTGAVWYHTWHGDYVATKELG